MNANDLLALATAKANAHAGLAEALEYGTTRVLRINGLDHLYADNFIVKVYVDGRVTCNGYTVNSTCRDLAYAAVNAYRAR